MGLESASIFRARPLDLTAIIRQIAPNLIINPSRKARYEITYGYKAPNIFPNYLLERLYEIILIKEGSGRQKTT